MRLLSVVAGILSRIGERSALEIKVPMTIAFADDAGRLLHFTRMAGALPASWEIAPDKAYTAAALRMTTREAGRLAQPGAPLYGIENTRGGRIVLFGGGFPLNAADQTVGAVGVSGGSVEQDIHVGEAVVSAFHRMVDIAAFVRETSDVSTDPLYASALADRIRKTLATSSQALLPCVADELTAGIILGLCGDAPGTRLRE
jgi:uncharacterized protein GlcG (DUF336 family)